MEKKFFSDDIEQAIIETTGLISLTDSAKKHVDKFELIFERAEHLVKELEKRGERWLEDSDFEDYLYRSLLSSLAVAAESSKRSYIDRAFSFAFSNQVPDAIKRNLAFSILVYLEFFEKKLTSTQLLVLKSYIEESPLLSVFVKQGFLDRITSTVINESTAFRSEQRLKL